ncbi:alpha/beta fold hydrolase [Actinopolymorpha pittospori]
MTLRWDPPGPVRGRLVLLHGELAAATTWWRVGSELAEQGWLVSALDLPGHGTMPETGGRPLDMPTLVQGVAERLPGQVDLLVGHGLGAIVALVLANRYVELTRAVVLEEPLSARPEDCEALADTAIAASALAHADRDRYLERVRETHPLWSHDDVQQALIGIQAADVPALAAALRRPRPWDLPALLGTLHTPALFLVAPSGADTPDATPSSALRGLDRLAAERRTSADRFVVLHGGHHLHRDLPDQWIKAVRGFADAVCPAPHP